MTGKFPKLRYIIVLLAILAVALFFFFSHQEVPSSAIPPSSPQSNSEIPSVLIKDLVIPVEVMRTPAEIERGLSGRPSLPADQGMLFLFSKPAIYQFWMPNMFFPIDIIWINNDRIVDISHNVPHDPPFATVIYRPKEPAQYVLEVNAGFSRKNGIVIGDSVQFKNIARYGN